MLRRSSRFLRRIQSNERSLTVLSAGGQMSAVQRKERIWSACFRVQRMSSGLHPPSAGPFSNFNTPLGQTACRWWLPDCEQARCGSSSKTNLRLAGNDRDAHVAFLSDMAGSGDAGNAVPNDD